MCVCVSRPEAKLLQCVTEQLVLYRVGRGRADRLFTFTKYNPHAPVDNGTESFAPLLLHTEGMSICAHILCAYNIIYKQNRILFAC